jgi:hypothetical protein
LKALHASRIDAGEVFGGLKKEPWENSAHPWRDMARIWGDSRLFALLIAAYFAFTVDIL